MEFYHQEGCNSETKFETKGIISIAYCLNCGKTYIEPIKCEHDYIPVGFILSNEKIQIRQYCKKCFSITPKSESHSNYDLNKLPKKSFEGYHLFYEKERENSLRYFDELRDKLDKTRGDYRREVYNEYLQTDHWTEIKIKVMERDLHTCQICGDKAIDVHHLTYAHRDNEFIFELVALCRKCHEIYY
jgi:5-methylcytosine-specific restriction endonuclease McrA